MIYARVSWKCKAVCVLKQILVRPFRPADLSRILEIESEAFAEDAYTRDMFLELHAACPRLFLVATRRGRVAGYIVTCAGTRKAEIISIAVDTRHRGQGVGKAIMEKTLSRLKEAGVRQVQLAVRPSNRIATRFYRNIGFAAVRRVARYYTDGGDALQMRLTLTKSLKKSPASGGARP